MIDRYKAWTNEDLPWADFDATRVNPELLKIVKAAALVEYNAHDYAMYLRRIFAEDAVICEATHQWADEETQHGRALGAWAEHADPGFSFDAAFARYKAGYRINLEAETSIRGSKMGEMIARCIVETGTSSYYNALADAADEPVLKIICRRIVADELRHYKMFHTYMKKYAEQESLGRLARLRIGLGRIQESEDDELAFAYYAANAPVDAPYARERYSTAYMARAFPLYRGDHIERMVAMVFRACGFSPSTFSRKLARGMAQMIIHKKAKQAITNDHLAEAA
jgi:rubrerythrin